MSGEATTMSEPSPQAVWLAVMDSARPPTAGTVPRRVLSVGQRVGRALVRLLVTWGLIVPVLFVPLVHLVMPFVLLALGPFLAFKAWRTTVLLTAGPVVCPKCAKEAAITEGTPGWPAHLFCGQCGATFFATPQPHPEGARAEFLLARRARCATVRRL